MSRKETELVIDQDTGATFRVGRAEWRNGDYKDRNWKLASEVDEETAGDGGGEALPEATADQTEREDNPEGSQPEGAISG